MGTLRGVPVAVESRWETVEPDGRVRAERRLDVRYRAGDAVVRRTEVRDEIADRGAPLAPWSDDLAWRALAPGEPLPPEADVLRALVHPTPRLPAARTSWSANFLVDGAPRAVRVPLRLELPAADRARWEARNAEVARRVAYAPDGARTAAGDALLRGWGDCTERADAWVALAADAGEVSRAVTGLVYADGAIGPGLYPHAWVEVSSGGGWIPVDPTLGQVPADATHLSVGTDAGAVSIVSIR